MTAFREGEHVPFLIASRNGEARRECAAKPEGRGGRITGGGGWVGYN